MREVTRVQGTRASSAARPRKAWPAPLRRPPAEPAPGKSKQVVTAPWACPRAPKWRGGGLARGLRQARGHGPPRPATAERGQEQLWLSFLLPRWAKAGLLENPACPRRSQAQLSPERAGRWAAALVASLSARRGSASRLEHDSASGSSFAARP
jgi:hypothetical protein